MTNIDERNATRVVSRDGTEVAYWVSGTGPPLVLVHGTTSNHTTWRVVLPYLEPHATVCAIDRRGRGASGDSAAYQAAREFEDVAAVIDAVAEATGSPVDVLGHSFGGFCAVGGALLTPNVHRLVLYEGWPHPRPEQMALPAGVEDRMNASLAAGDPEAALTTFYREAVMMSEDELRGARALPGWWESRVPAVPTIPRELDAELGHPADLSELTRLTVPVLLLTGADSPDHIKGDAEEIAAALPDAQLVTIEGQQHMAHLTVPERFSDLVTGFLRS